MRGRPGPGRPARRARRRRRPPARVLARRARPARLGVLLDAGAGLRRRRRRRAPGGRGRRTAPRGDQPVEHRVPEPTVDCPAGAAARLRCRARWSSASPSPAAPVASSGGGCAGRVHHHRQGRVVAGRADAPRRRFSSPSRPSAGVVHLVGHLARSLQLVDQPTRRRRARPGRRRALPAADLLDDLGRHAPLQRDRLVVPHSNCLVPVPRHEQDRPARPGRRPARCGSAGARRRSATSVISSGLRSSGTNAAEQPATRARA